MHELLALAIITILAVISPGPDFAMVTRNSYSFGRGVGMVSALGIAVGVQVHVLYAVFGVALLVTQSLLLFLIMKVAGAMYLIYLGIQSFFNTKALTLQEAADNQPTALQAFGMGFLTNAFNPKTMLFVVATFTQVVKPDNSLVLNMSYGAFMSFAHWVWFSLVALFFSNHILRRLIIKQQRAVDRAIGVSLIVLGGSLLFTNAANLTPPV
ncbi:LysE family translocator [Paenalcaligenes niemegkensis]|uniref:LysE family translocator n=1 Tax=Paenalcaligenes niemegkensis TaxID=2895469 RepID=UPI001EE99F2B|nr:LysE family translocator [Paenalcaligenes niemegkensis]MCQ9615698.1 LysE family translocator [Paenalcaligenes niemegkensis]